MGLSTSHIVCNLFYELTDHITTASFAPCKQNNTFLHCYKHFKVFVHYKRNNYFNTNYYLLHQLLIYFSPLMFKHHIKMSLYTWGKKPLFPFQFFLVSICPILQSHCYFDWMSCVHVQTWRDILTVQVSICTPSTTASKTLPLMCIYHVLCNAIALSSQ
jgi:hypothetical protein